MTIKEFEELIRKYKGLKINDIYELKNYLTNQRNYANNFTIEEITEGYILDDYCKGIYVFDEHIIADRDVVSTSNSGWTTTVIFIDSVDEITINDYFIHTSNGLDINEITIFLKDIGLEN